MRILVTGGAGFIGSAVIRHLIRNTEVDIVNVDKLTYCASRDSLRDAVSTNRYALEIVDICDRPALAAVFKRYRPDAVMHLAAESHVDRSIDAPAPFIGTNILGTYELLEVSRGYWETLSPRQRESFRFLHVSTDEVFGSLDGTAKFNETTPYAPNSPYSASKASSDLLVRAWHQTFGLPTLISNCSNNYGPYQFPEKLIPVVILAALEGRQIPVYGKGVNVRDWLFVEDHVVALQTLLARGVPGTTYNIGGDVQLTNIDLVRALCRILDDVLPQSPHKPHEKLIEFVQDRAGHDLRYAVDASKIQRELGWRPSVTLEDGLRRTVDWYLANAWWWQAIRNRGFTGERLGLAVAQSGL